MRFDACQLTETENVKGLPIGLPGHLRVFTHERIAKSHPEGWLFHWWARRDLNPGPKDYESQNGVFFTFDLFAKYKFSDDWLKTVQACAEAHVHYYDSGYPALALRVTRAGHKAFVRGDSPKFFPIAEVGMISLADARKRAVDILQRLEDR